MVFPKPTSAMTLPTPSAMESRLEFATFWILGLVNNFTFVVFITAAEEILEGYAGLILICTVLPGLLSRIVFALFAQSVPYAVRILIVSVSSTVCCLVVAYASSTITKLIALITQAALGALGEMAFLSLTARFSDSAVSAWASGTGAAGIAGAGAYVLLTEVLGLSSKGALTVCAPFAMLLIILYKVCLAPVVGFERLPSDTNNGQELEEIVSHDEASGNESGESEPPLLTRKEYFSTLLFTYMLPLAIVYFAEYTINQGVMGTLTKYKDGKTYEIPTMYSNLQFTYQLAVFLSRSSRGLIHIHRIWALPVLQITNLVVLIVCSIYVLLPSPGFAFLIVFWEGLLGGLTYVNAFARLRQEAPAHLGEWALGTATVGDASGISLAALVSIWLERAIKQVRGS